MAVLEVVGAWPHIARGISTDADRRELIVTKTGSALDLMVV